jgi:KamA family protein
MTLLADALATTERFRAFGTHHIGQIADKYGLSEEMRRAVELVSLVLPFRVNEYVLSHLIDWSAIPDDPMFQLVFPQPGMLRAEDERRLAALVHGGAAPAALRAEAVRIRRSLNPHPSGQMQHNVPQHNGTELRGMQHKYRETVLYFPGHGQTCHAYCTFCFRWAQFVGDADLRFAASGPDELVEYLGDHPEVHDVLITGGDPMIMSTERLRGHLEPLLAVETVRTIRIGTKALAYWPYRFLSDPDADALLALFDRVVAGGRTLAVMTHFTHPRELDSDVAHRALRRIRATGALVYGQAPLIAHVNDDAATWARLWRTEVAHGIVPYYLFVERDTGPYEYFKVPLAQAVEIFRAAYRELPGLARTVRGPVMSSTPGKIVVDGVESGPQGRFFQLRMLQARNPSLVGRPFRAEYSPTAAWIDGLRLDPATPPDLAAALRPYTA